MEEKKDAARESIATRCRNEAQFREKEKECDRKQKAARHSQDPKLREKEKDSIAARRKNEPFREKEKGHDRKQKAEVRKGERDKNLAKKADFSTPWITCLDEEDNLCFDDFENDPETAAMLIHHNSGTSQ